MSEDDAVTDPTSTIARAVSAAPVQPPLSVIVRCCPATRAAAVIGDSWIQSVLREMIAGRRRFSDFADRLNISRAVLTERLKRMIDAGLIAQEAAQPGGVRRNYVLSARGRDTIGIILMQDAWERVYGDEDRVLDLVDRTTGHAVQPILLTRPHGNAIEARRLDFVFDTACEDVAFSSNARRRGEQAQTCAELGAISVLGDPWSWRILIAAMLGVRRFDEFGQVLGIASNVLSDRLGRLVEADLLLRERYLRTPPRYEYRLAVAGRALHPLFCAMYSWGERWLYDDEPLPMRLYDRISGERVAPMVCDATTGEPFDAERLRPTRPSIAA